MNVGTAGHIDHGKTSLVKALTNVDCDRLKEEKSRGITIELGFAYWRREYGTIGFVDMPGHEKLIRNMLSGVTGIDYLLLVIAADDGPMPQTREHLAIAELLGLRRGIVVLTKCDLVDDDRRLQATTEIKELTAGTAFSGAPVVQVSINTGEGLEKLTNELDNALQNCDYPDCDGLFRLAVDRSFTVSGVGTVVTGAIQSGRVSVGDRLLVAPSWQEVRVRSLHAQGVNAEAASVGMRSALGLTGRSVSVDSVPRGSVLVSPELQLVTHRVDASLHLLSHLRRPLSKTTEVRFHHLSAEHLARVILLDINSMLKGRGYAQFVFRAPIAACIGDPFVIRDISGQITMGGGRILDVEPPRRRRGAPLHLARLNALDQENTVDALKAVLSVAPGWVDLISWFRNFASDRPTACRVAGELGLFTFKHSEGIVAMYPKFWREIGLKITRQIEDFHVSHQYLPGISQIELNHKSCQSFPTSVFRGLVRQLADDGIVELDRSFIRLPYFRAVVSPEEQTLLERLTTYLADNQRFQPPRVRDISHSIGEKEEHIRPILKRAAIRGELQEIAKDHFYLNSTIVECHLILKELALDDAVGAVRLAQFRDRIQSGRKVAIQILEFFDGKCVTLRKGDIRILNCQKVEFPL